MPYLEEGGSLGFVDGLDHADGNADEREGSDAPAEPLRPARELVLPVRHRLVVGPVEDHDRLQPPQGP